MNSELLSWNIADHNFCLWDWNLATGTIGLSKNWLDILGVDPLDYCPTSRWFNSLIHPDDLEIVLYHLEINLSGIRHNEGFIFRIRTSDNRYESFENKGIIVMETEDQVPGHVVWACERLGQSVHH